jgi:transposase InsO family protein
MHGELSKLGISLGRSTVRDILKRQHVLPAPRRAHTGSTWRQFLARHRHQILACDFFFVDSLFLVPIYVLFFIAVGTRRVHLAGCTRQPTAAWVTQQARNLAWHIQNGEVPCRFLIHDRDGKFPASFDRVFEQERVEILLTPYRAPRANAVAERWVRSVRQECLDHLLILRRAAAAPDAHDVYPVLQPATAASGSEPAEPDPARDCSVVWASRLP